MTISDMFLIFSSPLLSSQQFSTSQVFMEETTTAALLSPVVEIRPSCVSAVGRFVVGRWCVSKTHTSTFTASPAKVKSRHTHKHASIYSAHIQHLLTSAHMYIHSHPLPFSTPTLTHKVSYSFIFQSACVAMCGFHPQQFA